MPHSALALFTMNTKQATVYLENLSVNLRRTVDVRHLAVDALAAMAKLKILLDIEED